MSQQDEPNRISIQLDNDPKSSDLQQVREGLNAYNVLHVDPDQHQLLAVYLRDSEDQICGGLTGGTYWGWLHIDILWLREDLRGQGYGQRLMAIAEAEGVRRGCRHAMVDTHDFQAPDFYRKLGYVEWGVLEDLPAGHQRIFFRKELV